MADHREYLKLTAARNDLLRVVDEDDLDALTDEQVEDTYTRLKENEAALKAAE